MHQHPKKYVTAMRMINGRKKNFSLNSNSVNARHETPIAEDTNDMNIGTVRNDMVYSTRSIDDKSESARNHLATT